MANVRVHGDDWDNKVANSKWFLRWGHGRNRRCVPISPGVGESQSEKNKTFEAVQNLAQEEAVEFAEGVGVDVELWHRDKNEDEEPIEYIAGRAILQEGVGTFCREQEMNHD